MKVDTLYYGKRKVIEFSKLMIVNDEKYYVGTIVVRKNDQISFGKCKMGENYKIEVIGVFDSNGREVLPFKYPQNYTSITPYHNNTFLLEFYTARKNGFPHGSWQEIYAIENGKAKSLIKSSRPIMILPTLSESDHKKFIAHEFDFDDQGHPRNDKVIVYDLSNRQILNSVDGVLYGIWNEDTLYIAKGKERYVYNISNSELQSLYDPAANRVKKL